MTHDDLHHRWAELVNELAMVTSDIEREAIHARLRDVEAEAARRIAEGQVTADGTHGAAEGNHHE